MDKLLTVMRLLKLETFASIYHITQNNLWNTSLHMRLGSYINSICDTTITEKKEQTKLKENEAMKPSSIYPNDPSFLQ